MIMMLADVCALLRQYNIIRQTACVSCRMQRLYRNHTENYHQPHPGHPQISKSPLRRQNIHQHHPSRSPIRSRTPTRHVSPIKSTGPFPSTIKFISNLSPAKQPPINYENRSQFSNGKNLKFINSNYNDKIYETIKHERVQDYNRKSDRKNSQNNRLFGKLVDKIQSGKKAGIKGPDNYHKTSAFIENSQSKSSKMEQTSGRVEGGVFRQLFTQARNIETRSNKKPSRRQAEGESVEEAEELNCLVYKIKNPSVIEEQDVGPNIQGSNSYIAESAAANIPTIFMKRKQSKPQARTEQFRVSQNGPAPRRIDESEDLTEFNIFIQKIEGRGDPSRPKAPDEVVKMSVKVDSSLSMDPFL